MILLLVVIYITFISLGLPDSLFGVSWPLIHLDFAVPESFGSIYSVIIALTTGGVSFFAGPLLTRFGTGKVTAFSVLLTAISLLGISFSPNIIVMMIFSIIGGLGAGVIDTGLNNFISTHYKAIHMNWLHCFWGVGVTISPLIMSIFLKNDDWKSGYRIISYIQIVITIIVFVSLFLWKKYDTKQTEMESDKTTFKIKEILKTKGVIFAILTLGFYCCVEFLLGTWGASYFVNARDFTPEQASLMVSIYYGGIMIGRFLSGLLSLKLKDNMLIRLSMIMILFSIVILFNNNEIFSYLGMLILGIGLGPIFPSSLHAVPHRFGVQKSTYITGYLMGGAYMIGFIIQVIFGYIATSVGFNITLFVLLFFSILMFIFNEITIKKTINLDK